MSRKHIRILTVLTLGALLSASSARSEELAPAPAWAEPQTVFAAEPKSEPATTAPASPVPQAGWPQGGCHSYTMQDCNRWSWPFNGWARQCGDCGMADASCCRSCEESDCCSSCGYRLGVFADYLYLSAGDAGVAYARPQDGCTSLAFATGPVAVVNPDFESGFRFGVTGVIDERSRIHLVYTGFESSATDSVAAPEGSVIFALLADPNTLNCDFASSAAATAALDIDFDFLDLDYRFLLCEGCNFAGYLGVGIRWGQLNQDLVAEYLILGTTTVTTQVDVEGVGPRLGIDGKYELSHGIMAFGRGALSFLIADVKADFVQENTIDGVLVSTGYEHNRIIPIAELELGLGWAGCNDRLRILAGYHLSAWLNLVTTGSWINAVQTGDFSTSGGNLQDHLTFSGFFARAEFRF